MGMKDNKYSKVSTKYEGLLVRIFKNLTNPKRKVYRSLKKDLSRAKIDLYKLKQDTISTSIAKIILEIYKLSYPLRTFLKIDKNKKRFSPSFEENYILSFHNDKTMEIYKNLTDEDEIRKAISTIGVKNATTHFERLINKYLDFFDKDTVFEINNTFSNLLHFARFVHYDFYVILREFDPQMEDAKFLDKPSFSPVDGLLLRNEIYNLQQALISFDEGKLLDRGIELASKIKEFFPLDKKHYSKLKSLISTVKTNEYLILILKSIDKKLSPPIFTKAAGIDIFSTFNFKVRGFVFSTLKSIKNKIIRENINTIISKIFEEGIVGRIKNYSELNNNQFESLGLPGYTYAEALNYVKAFISDKYKPVISKLINELIVEGTFLNKGFLNLLSNSYYNLDNHLDVIEEFDNDLNADGETGETINRIIANIRKDKNAKFILGRTIDDVNKKAQLIISDATVNIKDLAKCIKSIIDDYRKKNPILVSNIKKIRNVYNDQFIKDLINSYTTIFYFLKLLGFFISLKVSKVDVENMKRTLASRKI